MDKVKNFLPQNYVILSLEKNLLFHFSDPKLIFQASLANAQILIPSNQASVSSMLLEGHTLLALATTMYAPGGVSQVWIALLPIMANIYGLILNVAEISMDLLDSFDIQIQPPT